MNDSTFPNIARVDAEDKVRGKALYAADRKRRGMLHGAMAVATICRGKLRRLDTSAARAVKGVRLVLTHLDLAGMKSAGYLFTGGFAFQSLQPLFSSDIAYRGQPIALVVADTLEAAVEAASRVSAEYDAMPFQVSLDAPARDIVAQQRSPLPQALFGDKIAGDAVAALNGAAVTIRASYTTPPQHQNPIELISTVAEWRRGTLVIHEGTQNSSAIRGGLARILDLDPGRIEVVSPQTGGGFGQKNSLQMQTVLAAIASRRLRRPVKIVVPRAQLFHDASFRPATRHQVGLGADQDGRIVAAIHDVDQQTSRHDLMPAACTEMTARMLGIPNFLGRERLVRTDVQTPGFMRAPWDHAGAFAFESAVDELSYALGIDPVELRLRNDSQRDFISGKPHSSRFLAECLRKGAGRFGWQKRDGRPGAMRLKDGTAVGWGVACGAYKAAMAPAVAKISATIEGQVRLSVTGHEMGQGIRTALANVLGQRLGVPPDKIEIDVGDTRTIAQHLTAGSWGTATAIPVADDAARALLRALDAFGLPGQPRASLAQLVQRSGKSRIEVEVRRKPHGQPDAIYQRLEAGLASAQGPVFPEFVSFSYAAHFVEVLIEPRTRRLRVPRVVTIVDCGRVVSPRTAISQVRGGVIWGIGGSLREISEVDPRYGGFLNTDLAEYIVPVNADIADIEVEFIDRPDPLLNDLGVKGLGEVATVGVAPAIANAVYHAIDKRIRHLPIRIEDLM